MTPPSRPQISAIERLQNLPALFRGADLTVRFQWTSKTASHYLYLWQKRGLVEALGGHSDVFANLLVNRHATWEAALLMAMPSACLTGLEVLRRAGWITQIPTRPEVAVNEEQSVFSTVRFLIQARPAAWFLKASDGLRKPTEPGSLPSLKPAWAMADLLLAAGWGLCGLTPDDIDWNEVTERDQRDWLRACKAFDFQQPELLRYAP